MTSRFDFVGHRTVDFGEANRSGGEPINNVIFHAENPSLKWVEETTGRIGSWRALFRSTYIGWALAINGIHVARKKYAEPDWVSRHEFQISSVREVNGAARPTPIARWESEKVAKAHMSTLPMLCCHGLIDLYACLEEFVFDFCHIFWKHNPEMLMQGGEFRELRRAFQNRDSDPAAWQRAFEDRATAWKRKHLYDGLQRVFEAYCARAGVDTPSWYTRTSVQTWADCIGGISLLRNCIIHGVKKVPRELAEFSAKPDRMGFDFAAGEDLVVTLPHLMNIEAFCDTLLTAMNASLFELATKAKSL